METRCRTVAVLVGLSLLCPGPAVAQESAAVRVAVGVARPYDDEPSQIGGAGSIRLPLRGRLGVEPELAITDSNHYLIWTLIPNVVYTFGRPQSPVAVYVIGGIGYVRERDKGIVPDYTSNGWTWDGGVGVRVNLTKGAFIAPDLRIGGNLSRLTLGLGYRW
jgi:hypothetical protein